MSTAASITLSAPSCHCPQILTQNEQIRECAPHLSQNKIQLRYLAAKLEENAAKWKKDHMQTLVIIWLILGLLTSILVVAALMLSSRLSQQEGVSENYDDWEAPEVVKEIYPRQAEQ